jgi:hypothetical protein
MAKTPDGGPGGPLDATSAADNGERRGPTRTAGDARPGQPEARTATPASSASPSDSGGKQLGERKKQFLIAPRHPDGISPMGFSPLSLSVVEQALRNSPDIEIVDTVGPKNVVGALADGMGGSQGVLVARMTDQKAGVLHQQGQGRLLVERDQYLGLMDAHALQPNFVTSVVPSSGPAFTAVVKVVGKDGAPVAGAEVSLFGSMLPATAVTDASGQVTLSLFGETAASVRSLYVKP